MVHGTVPESHGDYALRIVTSFPIIERSGNAAL